MNRYFFKEGDWISEKICSIDWAKNHSVELINDLKV